MQTQNDYNNDTDTNVDAEELNRAQQLWHNFTLLIKWGIFVLAFFLVLLGIITL